MSSETNDQIIDRGEALSEALRVYLEHRTRGSAESESALLNRYPELRELLEPLLREEVANEGVLGPGGVIGDYRLINRIGRGGMGEVWEAEQISLKRAVALKLLNGQMFASAYSVERFRREALAGARVKHPCIVAVHAVGESNGVHFISQELIESRRTLSTLVRDARELAAIPPDYWRDIAQLFTRLADALQFAHECGIIHRDIKPSNILLASDGTPKLADFGLALVAGESELSRTGDLSGSPFYMSPEQAAASRIAIDERSDVFSLGATLFEALTLQRPFEGDTVAQVLTKILFVDPLDPREIRSLCPNELAVICMKMLEKAPSGRYGSMREVADELERFLHNEPIEARPAGVLGRTVKWSRRHPVLAASSAIVFVSLCVVSALLWENTRARKDAENSARAAQQSALKERESARVADASAIDARLEADTSSRVVDFLVKAFIDASPTRTMGRELSAREVVDRGVKNIRTGLKDPKEKGLRARLLDSLGLVYSRLGLQREAEELLLEARALSVEVFGREDLHTLETSAELAMLWTNSGKLPQGVELMREVHDGHSARTGPESVAALRAEGNLGSALWKSYELGEAEEHLRHSVSGLKAIGEWYAPGLFSLSELLRARGKEAESLAMLHEALDLNTAYLGPDNPDTLNAVEGLARHELLANHVPEASKLFRQVAIARTCVLGPRHPTSIAAQAIAAYCEANSDPEQAVPELQQLQAISLLDFGPEDPTTKKVTTYLSSLMERMGRDVEAESALVSLLKAIAERPGTAPIEHCAALATLAPVEWRLGRAELALSMLDEVIALPVAEVAAGVQVAEISMSKAIEWREIMGDFAPALSMAKSRLARMDAKHPERLGLEETIRRLEREIEDP